jgi:hypothetical protein
MKDNSFREILVASVLIVLAVLLLNPFHFWMPDVIVMSILAITLVLFGIFASFIMREKVTDERDSLHRTFAGRNAFLAGSTILMVGIVTEGYSHAVDPWLVAALIVMILVKIVTRMWSDKNL